MSMEGQAETAPQSRTFCPRQRRRFVLWSAILASSMGFIDGSVVAIAIPSIRSDLPATLSQALWISNSYMLFLSSLILIGGAAGDSYGLRRVFMWGIGVFVAASAMCAIAPNAPLLIIARGLQGIGAAIMVPGSLAIIAKAYPADERGKAIGIWAAASAFTTTGGPILGGFLLSAAGEAGWRLIFAINLPLGCVALFMLWRLVPPDSPEGRRKIDWAGGLLVTLSLFLFAYGMTGSGGEGSIPDAGSVLLFLALGTAVLVVFIVVEARVQPPMVPLGLFSSVAFSGANILTFFLYFGLSAVLFYLPMTVISGWGRTPAEAAFAFVPFGASIAVLSGWSGSLADRVGPAPMIAAGSAIVAIAFAALAIAAPYQNLWLHVLPLMVASGIGMSLVVSPLSTAVMTAVTDADTGTASGINNAISRIAGLFAVAMMGLVAAAVFSVLAGGSEHAQVLAGISFGAAFDGSAAEMQSYRRATNGAFSAIAGCVAVMSAISAVVAWMTLRHGPAPENPG